MSFFKFAFFTIGGIVGATLLISSINNAFLDGIIIGIIIGILGAKD